MPKPRIPDPATIIYCVKCRKSINGKGYFGPGCMCDVKLGGGPANPWGSWPGPPR